MLNTIVQNIRGLKTVKEVFPYVEYLLMSPSDFDQNNALLNLIYSKVKKIKNKGQGPSMDEVMNVAKEWFPPFLKRKFSWFVVRGDKWYKYHILWVRKERFNDTLAFEYSILNMYYVRYSNACKQMAKVPHVKKEAAYKSFLKVRADLLGHIVKRKRWSWRKWTWESAPYNGDKCIAIGESLKNYSFGVTSWLLRYYEDMNKEFLEIVNAMSDDEEGGEEIFKNGEGWNAILYNIAEKGVFGDFNKVANEPIHKLVNYLNINKKEAKEVMRRIKENTEK